MSWQRIQHLRPEVDLLDAVMNPALRAALEYRRERLVMNQPKGWHHVSQVLRDAYSAGVVLATYDQYREARAVLAILTITED